MAETSLRTQDWGSDKQSRTKQRSWKTFGGNAVVRNKGKLTLVKKEML